MTLHRLYLAIGHTGAARVHAYWLRLTSTLVEEEISHIRSHMPHDTALGNPRFQAMREKTLGRPVTLKPRGRPAAQSLSSGSRQLSRLNYLRPGFSRFFASPSLKLNLVIAMYAFRSNRNSMRHRSQPPCNPYERELTPKMREA